MSTAGKVAAFVAGLAVLCGAAFGAGTLFADDEPKYALSVEAGEPDSAGEVAIELTVLRDGEAVTKFTTRHEKKLHLIAVRKDFGSYRHLHPTMSSEGEWTVRSYLPGGRWRLYADFDEAGDREAAVAHHDVTIGGDPGSKREVSTSLSQSVNGYDIEFGGPDTLVPNQESAVNFLVTKDGKDVSLEPYLGAYGHLVAIREANLSFLHVHPDPGGANGGSGVPFLVNVGAPGRYRLYLEFKHAGVVHTAAFIVQARTGEQIEQHEDMDHGDH
ncbi:hypothetical protein ABIE44_000791 [Marmoricola sp. OAE513]|uniref:hypothetical protein n=1 Tax=Marmoricola sp. OAE513 TaxID=2817894 RepID=UPI001AE29C88